MKKPGCLAISDKAPPSMVIVLFFPIFIHAIFAISDLFKEVSIPFTLVDGLIYLLIIGYLLLAILAVRRRELALKMILLVYSILIPLAGLELFGFISGKTTGGLPWPPTYRISKAADTMPGVQGEIIFSTNKKGVRAPDIWPASKRDRILCVGGSTTECMYITDQKSWPWLLGTKLSEKTGREILVANAGRGGHFTLHHIYQLKHYKYVNEFEAVIILCGINDVGTLLRNDYQTRATAIPEEALGVPVFTGAYYRHSYLTRLISSLRPVQTAKFSVIQDPVGAWYAHKQKERQKLLAQNTIRTLPAGLPTALQKYRENLVEIITLCKNRNQKLLLLTQPTLWHANMSAADAALLWEYTDDGAYTPEILEQVMKAYNDMLVKICGEYRVPYIDLAARLPKDTSILYDDCHFNIHGCEEVSIILCEYLSRNYKK